MGTVPEALTNRVQRQGREPTDYLARTVFRDSPRLGTVPTALGAEPTT
jgi:hypothetical protein